jgi:phosphoribosylformylglycinamidine synthase
MAQPRVLLLRAPGTNADQEAGYAFEVAGASTTFAHVNRVLENPGMLAEYQILCFPGGFSYGDDVSAGRILANQMRHHLADTLRGFKDAGKLILGICNGFQILIKSGVLLPDKADDPIATLTLNDSGRYEDRWVNLRVEGTKSVFLQGVERMYLPVAHAEGKFVPRDPGTFDRLEQGGQLVLRYCTPADAGSLEVVFPHNPNGAIGNVAGLCDETGRVLGLMPHPERFIDPTHHPRWTREKPAKADGLAIFTNAVAYFR